MLLEEAIQIALADGSPNTDAQDRVYPTIAPENAALPRITYQRITTSPQNSLRRHAKIDSVTIQVDCWARTKPAAALLARQVRGLMENQPFKALPSNEFDGFETESKLFRHTVEFTCWDKSFI